MPRLSLKKPLAILLILLMMTACASTDKTKEESSVDIYTEQEMYLIAQDSLKTGNYGLAVDSLLSMESEYPFGEYSQSAQLALIYAHFGFGEHILASAAADRFIRLHPFHRNVDYAYYMKALLTFPRDDSLFSALVSTDASRRDVSQAQLSFSYFADMVNRFPESEYTPDAIKRMEFLRNLLARHEVHIANYYLTREAYLAAANRGRYVIENFQKSPSVPDALAVMAQSYHEMGMHDLAEDSIATLKTNYPDHPAFQDDGNFDFTYHNRKDRSWTNVSTFGFFGYAKPPGFNTEAQYNPSGQSTY